MAGRHFFPLITEADVGPDVDKVLPLFPELEPFKYKAGMDSETVVAGVKGKTRVALEAPPCSRKSVDVPAALLRGGLRKLVVHCVPSRLLAVSTHDYVKTVHTDVVTRLVTDFEGAYSFPTDGLVHTSTGIIAAYMSAWRAAGVEHDFVLFLDEMHESDFATATLRAFQTAAPGVSIYIEATATRGAGGAGGTYSRATLPGAVNDYNFQRQPPAEWDLSERGKPWSLLKTTGDILIFEDDPVDARVICDKFNDAGVRAFRLNAKTTVDDFRRTVEQVRNPQHGEGIAVLVVDYSFRSGFTFPTVTRIIDQAEVRYLQMERGRAVYYKRNAYMSELYQARNRGGRIAGVPCDRWAPKYNPEAVMVSYEGVEIDLACMLHRMLGRRPGKALSHSPFYTGKVPRQFTHVLCGEQPLRAYKCDNAWPGESHAPPTPPPVSPMEPNFPDTPGSMGLSDAASVFTVEEGGSSVSGELSEEQFDQARQRHHSHVRSRPKPRLEDAPDVPRLDSSTADVFNDAFSKLASGGINRPRIDFGKYYYAAGLSVDRCSMYMDFETVLQDMGDMTPARFVRSIRGPTLHDVCAQALAAYNSAVVVATAANYVVQYAAHSEVIRGAAEPVSLREWAGAVRSEFVRANSRAQQAVDILLATTNYKYLELGGMQVKEMKAAEEFLSMLSIGMHDNEIEETYRDALPAVDFNPSGRYHLDIRPSGWRTRLALACLGGKQGYIDVATALDDSGGGGRVYTSASELALANTSRGRTL